MISQLFNLEIDKEFPIGIREKYSIDHEKFVSLRSKLKGLTKGFFILSTCNRISIFFTLENHIYKLESIEKIKELIFPNIKPILREQIEVIKHFFSISCGLESQIFAETDITHQIKQAYKDQKEYLDPLLNEMINYSLSVQKEFHSIIIPKLKKEKQDLAKVILSYINHLPHTTPVILIGYGIANKSIHKEIKDKFSDIWIFSDSFPKAQPKSSLDSFLSNFNDPVIIISATNSRLRLSPPPNSIIIDLSVPRSLITNSCPVIDLDKMKESYTLNLNDYKLIHSFLNKKVKDFLDKIIVQELKPYIKEFFESPLKIAEEKMEKYLPEILKIFHSSNNEEIKEFLKYVTQKIVNQSLEKPIEKIKELYILNSKRKIVVGTRGSKLALAQTNQILELLRLHFPQFEFVIKIIKTSGDKKIYITNSFVKELEEALIKEEIDLAIHSLKDIPYKTNPYLEIAAIPLREKPNDVLITTQNKTFWELKPNSVIGTSSPRRKKQIQLLRNDLIIKELKGNLDTRIKKLEEKEFDAIVVSYAGIKRLNLEKLIDYIFTVEELVPAPGQGAIAIQTRKQSFLTEIIKTIDNHVYRKETQTERELMGLLNLGCSSPFGAYAEYLNNTLTLHYFINIQNKIFKEKIQNPNLLQIKYQIYNYLENQDKLNLIN